MKPILWIGLLVLPLGVWGADAPVSSLGPTQAPPVKVTVSGGYGGDADLAGGGHIARWESAWDVEIPVNPTSRTGGRFSAGWGLTELDVGDLPGESVDALHTLSVGYFGVAPVKGDWSAFYRGGAMMVFEEGAAGADAWLYQGMAGLDRRVGPTLSLQAGLLGTTLLEEDPRVLPLLGFRWRPAPGWSVATEGLGIQVRGPLRPGAQFWVRSRWFPRLADGWGRRRVFRRRAGA